MSQPIETKPADAPAPAAAPIETKPVAEAPAPAAPAAAPPVQATPEPAAAPAAAPVVDAAAIEARIRAENEATQQAKIALCKTAGRMDLLPEMLSPSLTVGQVGERLLAAQAQKSQGTQIHSQVDGSPVGAESQLNAAATNLAAQKHITFAQAYAEVLKGNPNLYTQYLAEKSATVKPN
jgi:hypothetical protein